VMAPAQPSLGRSPVPSPPWPIPAPQVAVQATVTITSSQLIALCWRARTLLTCALLSSPSAQQPHHEPAWPSAPIILLPPATLSTLLTLLGCPNTHPHMNCLCGANTPLPCWVGKPYHPLFLLSNQPSHLTAST
jgi:hypothetical protein